MPLLTWRDRDADLTRAALAPYRLLEHRPDLSYGDQSSPNMLIQGDNLDALKALLPYYAGQVKCIYIDPPFNTKQALPNYDDNLEHSKWLSIMYARLELLRDLLRPDGCIFVHLDDNELDYCRVIMDELFGRSNFMNRITVEARSPSAFSTVNPGVFKASEYILWYAKDKESFTDNPIRTPRELDYAYSMWLKNPDDPHEKWEFQPIHEVYKQVPRSAKIVHPKAILNHFEKFVLANARQVCRLASISDTGAGEAIVSLKAKSQKKPGKIFRLDRDGGLDPVFVLDGQQLLFYSKNVVEVDGQLSPTSPLTNVWTDIAWEGIAKEGGVVLKKGKKPERLLRRCIELGSRPGDLVLDSFLGSGTTAAVAHKMGRRWIGIDMGEQAQTHCQPRLKSVVDGEQSGVSKLLEWKGGGGFRFFSLGPSLFDEAGNVREGTPFAHLAAHVWFSETKVSRAPDAQDQILLGVHEGMAYYLLYGEPAQATGTTLTRSSLRKLPPFDGPKVVFGEACLLSDEQLEERKISFKQLPYDLKAR